eukprot:3548583-Rhodomonas_salina.1
MNNTNVTSQLAQHVGGSHMRTREEKDRLCCYAVSGTDLRYPGMPWPVLTYSECYSGVCSIDLRYPASVSSVDLRRMLLSPTPCPVLTYGIHGMCSADLHYAAKLRAVLTYSNLLRCVQY